jgi:putative ABC transport system permease protein
MIDRTAGPPRWVLQVYRGIARCAPLRIRERVAGDQADLFVALWHEERPAGFIHRAAWIVAALGRACLAVAGMHADEWGMRRRSAAPGRPLAGFASDLRLAWRQYRARPLVTLTAIATLGLALGLNTTLYSAADAVLFRSPGYADPDRVVFLWNVTQAGERDNLAPARALDFVEQTHAFSGVALVGHLQMTVTGREAATRWSGASVTSNFFDVLGAQAEIGRTFDVTGSADEVVLSARLWRTEFGSDPQVVGRTLVMNGRPRLVAGIMRDDFYWPAITAEPGPVNAPLFWTSVRAGDVPERPGPRRDDARQNRSAGYIRAVARLKDGVAIDGAQAELSILAARLAQAHPATDAGRTAIVVSAHEQLFGAVRRPLLLLLLATGAVVLLACLNVANLLLVRLASRAREVSMRVALGATSWRLMRQFAVEGIALAATSAVIGLAASIAGRRLIAGIAPETVGRLDTGFLSWQTVGVAAVIAFGAGLIVGLLPAIAARRRRVGGDLRLAGAISGEGGRTRNALVAAQVALSLMLLTATGLFSQSLLTLRRVDVGLRPEQLLTFDVALTGNRAERPAEYFTELVERIRHVPGVRHAAGAVTLPIGGDDFGTRVRVEGQPPPAPGTEPRIGYQVVTPGWFDTLGMRVVDGRDFAISDDGRQDSVAIVNTSFARMMWPDGQAVGRRILRGRAVVTVVGLVTDVRHGGPAVRPRPEIYEPLGQAAMPFLAIAVRASGDPLALVAPIRRVAMELDPAQPISGVSTMQAHLDRAYGDAEFLWALTLTFGLAALVIAGVGIHAVVSLAMSQRRRELGLRLALGATPRSLASQMAHQGGRPVVLGGAIGLVLALALSRIVSGFLFETSPYSPLAFAAAVGVLFACAALALWLPARAAAAVDPVRALRE